MDLVPDTLGSELVNLDDGNRYTLGVGRQFNDALSGSVTLIYEPEGDDLVSPLGPTNGMRGISIGGRYAQDGMAISGGVNYSVLGDAQPEVGDTAVAQFSDMSAVAVGLQATFEF